MKHMGGQKYSLWDEDDGFFYDVLRYPDGRFEKFRVRSLVGIIPLYAVEQLQLCAIENLREFRTNFLWFVHNRTTLAQACCHCFERDGQQIYQLTVVDQKQMRRMLARILDPSEFLSDYGIRSLSKYHSLFPYVFDSGNVRYEPAESDNKIKGGNSSWRGPIWFPTTFLMIDTLRKLDHIRIADSAGDLSETRTLTEVAADIADRMIRIFKRNQDGLRPVYGGTRKFQEDPHWRDLILFYEFFHGDNGAGLGASHQTGWTGLVAVLIDEWRR
jgi:hypothetical protein